MLLALFAPRTLVFQPLSAILKIVRAILRADAPGPRRPVVYEPTVCVVAQGRKRVYLGDDSFVYDAWHYLVLSVPLPMDGEILEASPEHPFLALRLHLNATALGEIMLQAGVAGDVPSNPAACRGVCASRFDAALHDAVCRLAAAVGDPRERPVLAPLAEREVLYRLVTGERGQLLREFALRDSRSYRISRVLQHIRKLALTLVDVCRCSRAGTETTMEFYPMKKGEN